MASLWKCPKCGRRFKHKGQSHSCTFYPVARHFKGKPELRALYDELVRKARVGMRFHIDSLPCCIHLATSTTFSAVFAKRDCLMVEFMSDHKVKSRRIVETGKLSAKKYQNFVKVASKRDIDKELIGWIRRAYDLAE